MNRIFIIAEAGVNHNGSIDLAKKLVDAAKDAGADGVKFQTFKAEKMVSRSAEKAQYQMSATGRDESQLEMLKRLELDERAHVELQNYCEKRGIEFLSTPFDQDSVDLLNRLGFKTFKIASGEITNLPYLRKIGKLKKRIILSTGMADLGEIEDAIDVLISSGTPRRNITILHCNTEYPTSLTDVNLRAMITIRNAFDVDVGYSDHTLGIEIPVAAAALGATIIEKHLTLDKQMDGPDHKASLEPHELKMMVTAIRNVEKALGDGIKKPSLSELKNKAIARKSIVAASPIKEGETFTEMNIAVKRPGTGITPMRWDEIIGRAAAKSFERDELIET